MANKCPKTLANKGLSGILCFDEDASATLLQHAMEKARKRIVASGYQMLTRGTMGAIITIILIVLVVEFALSQPYNFEGALSY